MTAGEVQPLLLIVVLLGISGVFSASEVSFLALSRRHAPRLDAGRVLHLFDRLTARPAVTLGAILIAITAVNYAAEAIAATWVLTVLQLPTWIAAVAVGVLLIVFAEVVPISYAAANPDRVARSAAVPVWLACLILAPFARTIGFIADLLTRLVGARPGEEAPVTEGEIRAIVDIQAETGNLEEEEKVMIHQIFEFGETVAREVMVPRTDMSAIPINATAAEAGKVATERRISRMPVYQGDLDTIIGMVHIKDVIPLLAAGQQEAPITGVMRQPLVVPETKRLSELLEEFRRRRRTLAVVVDEYGGTAGIVTLEDLLEEVVGDIYDEYDEVRPMIEQSGAEVLLDARVSIEEASGALNVELPAGEYDSLAGLMYAHLGKIPRLGDLIEVAGARLTVAALEGHRITRVRAVTLPVAPGEEAS